MTECTSVVPTPVIELKIEIISEVSAFRRLKNEWNALLAQSAKKSFFLTWEWQFHWWEFYQTIGVKKILHIIVIRDVSGKIQAILPLYKAAVRSIFRRKLHLFYFIGSGHESSEYLDALILADHDPQIVDIALESLQQSGTHGLHFSDLRDDSFLVPVLQKWAAQKTIYAEKRDWKTCPFIPLQGDYDSFINSLSKNMRYNIRRRTRNLQKNHGVNFRLTETLAEAEQAVTILYDLHRKRWATREGASKFDDPQREKFHRHIAPVLLQSGYLRFFILEVDKQPVATLYCFSYGGHVYYYQAGMEPEMEKKSIGMVVMGKAIEASFDEGAHEYDFLRGLEDYKFRWTDQTRDTFILEIAFSKAAATHFAAQAKWRNIKKQIKKVIKD